MLPEIIKRMPDEGTGQAARRIPMLFVHGACLDGRCWDDFFMPFFAEVGYMCWALNLRGHECGRGWWTIHAARLRDYVEDLRAIIETLPAPPILVGHSMGSHVIQKYLQTHSVPAAVLMNPVPPAGTGKAMLRVFRLHASGIVRDTVMLRRNTLLPTPEQLRRHCFSPDITAEDVARFQARLHLESIPALLDMLVLDRPRSHGIDTPILVLGGARDALFDGAEVRATAQALNAPYVIFPDIAHNMMQDTRWRDVAAYIHEWLGTLDL